MTLLVALLMTAAAPPPAAGESVRFFEHDDGGMSYYDDGSVERSGATVRVWVRWATNGAEDLPFHEGRILDEIDCAQRTARVLRMAAYAADGSLIVSEIHPTSRIRSPKGRQAPRSRESSVRLA